MKLNLHLRACPSLAACALVLVLVARVSAEGTLFQQFAGARGVYEEPTASAATTPVVPTQHAEAMAPELESPYLRPGAETGDVETVYDDQTDWFRFEPSCAWPWGPRTPKHLRHCEEFPPLEGTSWLNRPLSAGWGMGFISADELIHGRVVGESGFLGVYRVGWDYDYYWGVETRLGLATVGLENRFPPYHSRTVDMILWDVSLLWYPTGDTRLRPYFCVGMGSQSFDFYDHNRSHLLDNTFAIPMGFGLKYMYSPWFALRGEITDNIAWGANRVDSMHNLGFTAGVEIRFGGRRPSYWPWNPNRKIF